jgi:AsmA-like C-terminal region
VAVVATGLVSLFAWRNLQARIKSPDFKAQLEQEIFKLTGGQATLGSLDGRLSFHPWLSVQNVSLILPRDTGRFDAAFLRLDVKILPLLRKHIVFSHIEIEAPHLVVQRPKNIPQQTIETSSSQRNSSAGVFQIESLSLQDGRFTFIDKKKSNLPLIEISADASITDNDNIYLLQLDGNFTSPVATGALEVTGELFSDLGWKVSAQVKNPMSPVLQTTFPVDIDAVIFSSGPLIVDAAWHSTGTIATINLTGLKWSEPNYTVNIHGSQMNGSEVTEVVRALTSKPTVAPDKFSAPTSSSWTVHANWDVKNIQLPRDVIPRSHGEIFIKPRQGNVPHMVAEMLGGTVSVSGTWGTGVSPQAPTLLSLRAEGKKIQVERVLALTISTVPWTGAFNVGLTLVDFPVLPMERLNVLGILESIAKSRAVKLDIDSETVFRKGSPLTGISGLMDLDPISRLYKGVLNVNWIDGEMNWNFSVPRASKNTIVGPLDIALKIKNMDLSFLPELAQRLAISKANVDADMHWRAERLTPGIFRTLSPDVVWSVDGYFRELVWRNIPLDKVTGLVRWNKSEVQLQNIHGETSSGTFVVDGTLSNPQADGFHRFSSSATISNIEVAPFMFALSTNPVLLRGRCSSTVELSGDLRPWNHASLNGMVHLSARNGRVRSGSFTLGLVHRLNLKSLIDSMTGHTERGLPFNVIEATGSISGGHMTLNNPLFFKSPHLEAAYTGWVGTDFKSGEGSLVVNPLVGMRNLLTAIPGVSNLMLGPNGEFLPLIVDVNFKQGKLETNFRSIQSLTDLPLRIIGNVIRLPAILFGGGKKK